MSSLMLLWITIQCLLQAFAQLEDDRQFIFPRNITTDFNNTVWIGVILANHRTYVNSNYESCGDLNSIYVIHGHAYVYAIKYANEYILKDHGIKLGIRVLDSCDNADIGFKRGIQFIQGDPEGMCSNLHNRGQTQNISVVTGIDGSDVAMQVASLMQYFCVPAVWAYSTTPLLDEPLKYKYTLRTVPSDIHQTEATVALLLKLNWRYVAIVYEDTSYGKNLYTSFMQHIGELTDKDKAIAVQSNFAIEDDATEWWPECKTWLQSLNTSVILVFTDYSMAENFFVYFTNDFSNCNKYMFVGVDGWSNNLDVVSGNEHVMNMSITTEPMVYDLPDYTAHLRNETYHNTVDCWLQDLIGQQHHCNESTCVGNETLHDLGVDYAGVMRAHYVVETVFLIAKTFAALHETFCPNQMGLCHVLKSSVNGSFLYQSLQNATFTNVSGPLNTTVSFNAFYDGRSGPPKYTVFQYFCRNDSNSSCTWQTITTYDGTKTTQKLGDISKLVISPQLHEAIEKNVSNCFPICPPWERITVVSGKCSKCFSCEPFEIFDRNSACIPCNGSSVPSPETNYTICVMISPDVPFHHFKALKYSALCVSVVCLLLTLIAAATYIFNWATPIVRGAIPELTFSLLFSVAIQLVIPMILTMVDPEDRCLLVPVLWFMSITLAVAVLFARATIIAGWCQWCNVKFVFESIQKHESTVKFYTPQLYTPLLAQAAIMTVTLLQSTPTPDTERQVNHTSNGNQYWTTSECPMMLESDSMILLIVPAITLLGACWMSFYKQEIPIHFCKREAQQINFAVLSIILCFMVTLIAILSDVTAEPEGKLTIEMVGIFVIPVICLTFVVLPTTYKLLFQPELNSWQNIQTSGGIYVMSVRQSRRSSSHRQTLCESMS